MKEKRKKPTVKGGLERGAKGIAELLSSKEGRRLLLVVIGSMLWFMVIMPASCMKLGEVFETRAVAFFTGCAMFVAWISFLVILRQKGIHIDWPKPKKPKRTVYVKQTRVEITEVRKAGSRPAEKNKKTRQQR